MRRGRPYGKPAPGFASPLQNHPLHPTRMRRPSLLDALLLVASWLLQPNTASAQDAALPDSTRLAVDRVFAGTANDAPGCAVGISRGGRLIYENGYGMANLETGTPITAASIFHVASVSKQFTAMSVMLLARDGKLSLDDDIRRFLPEIPDYGHRITIRHLLTHTSGLRDQWDLLAMARGRFQENRITDADVLEIVARQKALNFVPGTEYLYSNTGYTLAGTIVRRVSGRSLRDFADERIFRPLGMTRTHFHDDYTMVVPGRTSAYERRMDDRWHVSIPNFDTYGATSLYSTVGDLLKWEANVAAPTVGDESILRQMNTSATLANGDTTGYGLGRATEKHRGAWLVGHSGSDAGYRAYLGQFPEHRLAVAVLCNRPSNPANFAREVAAVLLGDALGREPAPAPAVRQTVDELRSLAGVYVNPATDRILFVSLRDDALTLGRASGPKLVPIGERRFRAEGAPSIEYEFRSDGTLLQHRRTWPSAIPITFTRHAPARPTPAALRAYAGTYDSEELGATYTVVATDSTLVLETRGGNDRVLRPAYGDVFVGDVTIAFTRRGSRIDGLLMGSSRVRRVRFARLP